MQELNSSSSAFGYFELPMHLQRPWLRHAKEPFICKSCLQRAHPDLNQGPADLQSAALTTELCTRMSGWLPTCWLQGRRTAFALHWLHASLMHMQGFTRIPHLNPKGLWRTLRDLCGAVLWAPPAPRVPQRDFAQGHTKTLLKSFMRELCASVRALRARVLLFFLKESTTPIKPPTSRISSTFGIFFCFFCLWKS